MIRYLRNSEIDAGKWDETILQSVNTSIYAYSWYLDIVCDSWDALVEDDYVGVMPLPWKQKAGIKYLYQPPFTQQLGLFSPALISEQKTKDYIDAIPSAFRYGDVNLNKHSRIAASDTAISENTNYELELIRHYDSIRKAYSQNLRRNLKKADGNHLQVHKSQAPEPIIRMFRENRGSEINNLVERDYTMLRQLTYQMIHKGVGEVYAAYDQSNELCAGMIIAEIRGRSIFLFSGLSEKGRSLNAMPYLIDHYLRLVAGSERIFDFEGSNDPGLARFYASFGATASTYQSVRIDRLPKILKPAFWFYRKLRS